MKKKLFSLILVVVIALSIMNVTACNQIQSGKLEDIVGTYELTRYSYKYKQVVSESESVSESEQNVLEEDEMVSYIVVGDNGYGYFVYGDKETELEAKQVKMVYNPDDEDANLIKSITFNDAMDNEWTVYVQSKNKTLTSNKLGISFTIKHTHFGNDYDTYVTYTWRDKTKDLSYVNSKLNEQFAPPSYESVAFDGLYFDQYNYFEVYEFLEDGTSRIKDTPYVCVLYDFDVANKKAVKHYVLKEDKQHKTEEVSIDISFDTEKNIFLITVGEETYQTQFAKTYYALIQTVLDENQREVYKCLSKYHLNESESVDSVIDNQISLYENFLALQQEENSEE